MAGSTARTVLLTGLPRPGRANPLCLRPPPGSVLTALRLSVCSLAVVAACCAAADVLVFGDGHARLFLDVDAEFLADQQLEQPVADFDRCFQAMTGCALPNTMKRVALFDPVAGTGLRLQASVLAIADRSDNSSQNGMLSLVLTPTQMFPGAPLAGPGEKASWSCTWQRGRGTLEFALVVANQPYRGPGYGPYTFASASAPVPDWQSGQIVELALELRRAGGQDLRGGYRIAGGEWIYTDWCDPTKAGSDTRQPGVSDKAGPQAWTPEWPGAWAGRTAAYVAGYGAKGRDVVLTVDDVGVTGNGHVLFSDGFAGPDDSPATRLPQWRQGPREGQATLSRQALVLAPAVDGWSTVGLMAAIAPAAPPDDGLPLRLCLLDWPESRGPFDVQLTQGWRRQVGPDGVLLSAHTCLGLQNALYALLDHWGCRWVMAGDLGECIPTAKRLTVPVGSFEPRVYNDVSMSPCGSGNPHADFYVRNQAGFRNWVWMGHYWLTALPPERHFATHPEWYSLIAGRRQPKQLCTSNPEVVTEMIRVAKAFLAGSPQRVCFPMEPMDGIDFCECPECRALDVPGQFTDGAPSVTDRVVHFANAVAAGIKDEFPDRYVGFYAYWTHVDPPRREVPAANVLVGITRSHHCLLHLTPTRDCPTSDFHSLIRAWRRVTPNLYAYEYDPISWTGSLPCPTWLDMGRSLQAMFLKLGVRGSYSDLGVKPCSDAGAFLNRYIPLRMKLDPTQTPEDVLEDMCRAFFGPAAAALQKHYLEMAKVTSGAHAGLRGIGVGTTYYHMLFNSRKIRRARAFLDRGRVLAAGTSPYAERVAMVDLAQQYLEAYLGGVWASQAKDYDGAVASFDRMDAVLARLIENRWADAADAPSRAKVMRLKALAEHFPDRLGYVTDWKLLGPFDNTSLAAEHRAEPFEPLTSVDGPVRLADGRDAQWWGYRSPGGFLNLEKATAGKRGSWLLSYAYAATVIQADREMPAQLRMDSFFPFRVFLNGTEVFNRPGLNADCPDRRLVDVRLRRGPNVLVAKLCQTQITTDSFPWGLYLRVVPDDTEDVVVLPASWPFRTDPGNVGERERWYAADLDHSAWAPVRVGLRWEEALGPYDGYGWYRVRFRLPDELPTRAVALRFGGCDEQAWVYLNGEYLGERTVASTGRTVGEIWEEPFMLAVPVERLRRDGDNVLAVRVHDSAYAGGLFRPVRLVIAK